MQPPPTPDARRAAPRAVAATAAALAASWCAAFALRGLHSPLADLEWYGFGFHDERWLVAGYWLSAVSVLFVPLWFVPAARDWAHGRDASEPPRRGLRVALALAVYALWVGPPWNLAALSAPMEWHEIVHLGPLQALIVGKDFYLESGTQYGPGMQTLALHYLEHFGISLLSFREFWMWTNFAGGAVVVAWLAWLFPVVPLVVGALLLRFFSPFEFLRPDASGSYGFFFGWASCIRYAGALHAVLALGWTLGRDPSAGGERERSGERIFLLLSGILYGITAQISQENLGCGGLGAALLFGWALASRAVRWPRALAVGAPFALGAALAVVPLVAFFASAGRLDDFLARYFGIGALVASGYSNTPFHEPWSSPAGWLYGALPVGALAVFCAAATTASLPRRARTATAAVAIAALACFAPALLRTDPAHIVAAATPLGLLVAAALTRARDTAPRAPRLAFALAALALLACLRPVHAQRLAGDVAARVASWRAPAPEGVVGDRVGYRYDLDSGYSVFSDIPLREFLELGRAIREKVGERPLVIASAVGTRGHWYFFADLRPWMPDPEPSMTIVNNRLRAHYLAELDRRGIPCVMSTRPQDTELVLYRRQPGPRHEWTFDSSAATFYVSCLDGPVGVASR